MFCSYANLGGFRRGFAPPRYGYHGYYYNYPGLVLGTAILGTALIASSIPSSHTVYVRQRQQVATLPTYVNVKRYYVEVPADIYPGETFRVVLDGEEVIVTCPEISGPGERILITVEQPANQPVVINGTVVSVSQPAQAVIVNHQPDSLPYPTSPVVVQQQQNAQYG